MGESVPARDTHVTVSRPAVQRFLLQRYSGHERVYSNAAEKYLTARVEFPDFPYQLDHDDFALVTGGERYPALADELSTSGSIPTRHDAAFALPADRQVNRARVRVTDREDRPLGEWRVGEEVLRRLNDPPAIEVVSVSVPETVGLNANVTISFELRNTGPVAGTFVYAVGTASQSHPAPESVSVPANTDPSHEAQLSAPRNPGSVIVEVDYGRQNERYRVEVTE